MILVVTRKVIKEIFSEYFVTGQHNLGPELVPIGNMNDRNRILYPKSSLVVNYTKSCEIIFCFGGL